MFDRALIVRKPWINLILSGEKTWEMRAKKTKIRGRIGLIEAGAGLIVGEVSIVDSLDPIDINEADNFIELHRVEDTNLLKKWRYPWVLKNAWRWSHPKPVKVPRGAMIWVRV